MTNKKMQKIYKDFVLLIKEQYKLEKDPKRKKIIGKFLKELNKQFIRS